MYVIVNMENLSYKTRKDCRVMFRTIKWYFKFVFCLILKTVDAKKADKILKQKGENAYNEYVYDIVSRWAMARVKDSGAEITVHGKQNIPKDKTVLFVSNHQSDFDIAIFLAMIPEKKEGFVAKVELEKIPFLSAWMKRIHCIFLDRNDMKQSAKTILEGIKLLKSGHSMVVFPEGTRSKCDEMGEFKAGSFKLATKSKVPIVPVTIDGSYKILEGSKYRICPAKVNVYIHEPIETENLSKQCESKLPEMVEKIIREGKK